jgi:hypothetical protein
MTSRLLSLAYVTTSFLVLCVTVGGACAAMWCARG